MIHYMIEATADQGVLLQELVDFGPLREFERLRPAARHLFRGTYQSFALMGRVTEGHHIPHTVSSVVDEASDFLLERQVLPLEG